MFEQDLQLGKTAEYEFAKRIMERGALKIEFAPTISQFKDRDIKIEFERPGNNVTKSFEVKTNPIFDTTGDVCFEVSCNGVPSGVYSSKADYIVYLLGGEFYYQDRGKLLIMLNTIPHEEKIGGDGNRCKLYIVKGEYLSDLFKKL